ncbi:glycosyl transferase family protein [Yoonia litorea]|uniref:Anthranilate phosphoribosyltransferase n=1 Tax=Yoonia litorea TaxID=1123755 RepID=A0A1I6LQV0_9RHOB|nr:glycosyl transferase family protein [Yoonia litorea]SFS05877.1 Anthranilate phosphoribosyltransferase [Yoonia litorea]
MSLAPFVQIVGRGPGRSRSLTMGEAASAMDLMLTPEAAPEAFGALLMLLRMKGETAEEIAGFAQAAQAALPSMPGADLDWPSYAAGRTRGAPWFLLSARIVADAGHRVLLHGWNGTDQKVRDALSQAGIRTARTPDEASAILDSDSIAYLPLENFHPALFSLLRLRDVLGLRSCINTVCRMLNPAAAASSVQGVFHPSYRLLQADAASLLGWQNLTVIKGGGGEFERHPAKDIAAFGLRNGALWEGTFNASVGVTRRLAEHGAAYDLNDPTDFDESVIVGTAAAALETLGWRNATKTAHRLWRARTPRKAA